LSSVEGCRSVCDRYFHRYFQQSDSPPYGTWVVGSSSISLDTINLPNHYPQCTGFIPLNICNANCGPPNCAESATPYGDDPDNDWRFTNFARHNPNTDLHGWLRSYDVNADKAASPRNVCNKILNDYCTDARVTSGTHLFQKRAQCEKGLLVSTDFHPFDFNLDTDPSNDSFCDSFFLGNYMCDGSCYQMGDSADVPSHRCQGDWPGGELVGGPCVHDTAICDNAAPRPFNVARITSPSRSASCGVSTAISGLFATVVVSYTDPLGAAVSNDDVVSATWTNKATGVTGQLVPITDGQWNIVIRLNPGPNTIKVQLTDNQARTSGDAIDLVSQ
jgi:hypothetical protein